MAISLSDLKSANSSASLTGASGGTLNLTNQSSQYSKNDLWGLVQLDLESTATVPLGVSDPDDCFNGTLTIVGGVLTSFDDKDQISEGNISFRVQSIARRLEKKPINTQFYNALASTILTDMLEIYGGVPSSFIDMTGMGNNYNIYAAISGSNLLQEAKKIAEASRNKLYEGMDGKIYVSSWKDTRNSVAYTIPKEAIDSASRKRPDINQPGPSRILVRGRYVSNFDAGQRVLTNTASNTANEPADWQSLEGQGKKIVSSKNGLKRSRTTVILSKPQGTICDLKNAAVRITEAEDAIPPDSSSESITNRQELGDQLINITQIRSDGRLEIEVASDGNSTISAGENQWEYDVVGAQKDEQEFKGPTLQQGQTKEKQSYTLKRIENFRQRMVGGVPTSVMSNTLDDTYAGDESDPTRMETMLEDPDLLAEFGVVTEQIDNEYVSSYEDCFETAIRRFQEYKIERNTWNVSLVFLPCIKPNDVVTFTSTDDTTTVTGVVQQVNVSGYSPGDASCKMNLTVLSFEDIGSTVYVSQNLLLYPNLIAANGAGPGWQSNQLTTMLGGFAAMRPGAWLRQTLTVETGATYTVKATFTGTLYINAGGQVTAGTGNLSLVIAAAPASSITILLSTVDGGYLSNVELLKTVTR